MSNSLCDKLISVFDSGLRTVFNLHEARRDYPADHLIEPKLSEQERRDSAKLMRVNHAGEIAAQALYQGQKFSTQDPHLAQQMTQAGEEEIDHLVWCQKRLLELESRTSYLALLWFYGAFTIGFAAGKMGQKWNLGFLAETENQVVAHLSEHLLQLPVADIKSRVILEQMRRDEAEHADKAMTEGGVDLPTWSKMLMRMTAGVMKVTARII